MLTRLFGFVLFLNVITTTTITKPITKIKTTPTMMIAMIKKKMMIIIIMRVAKGRILTAQWFDRGKISI